MRHEDNQIYQALDEVFRVAREAGVRAEVSHIKLAGPSAWGQADRVLAYIEKARAEGLDVTQDQYAYTASSTTHAPVDSRQRTGRRPQANSPKRIADPEQKAKIVAEMKQNLRSKGRDDYSLRGHRVVPARQVARTASTSPRRPRRSAARTRSTTRWRWSWRLKSEGGASGVFHGMSEDDLKIFMRHPNTMIACDSGLRKLGEGMPHPRGYGNNARVLARYVRELKVLRLEDAIRKMTSLPANTFHFKGRGELREGNWADIVVFDPEKVQDTSTYKDPHHYATGIPVRARERHPGNHERRAHRRQGRPGFAQPLSAWENSRPPAPRPANGLGHQITRQLLERC